MATRVPCRAPKSRTRKHSVARRYVEYHLASKSLKLPRSEESRKIPLGKYWGLASGGLFNTLGTVVRGRFLVCDWAATLVPRAKQRMARVQRIRMRNWTPLLG